MDGDALRGDPDGFTLAWASLLALACVDAAGYGIIGPVAPQIAASTGAGPAVVGALVASFPVGIMLGFIVGSYAIARRRDRTLLAVSVGLIALGSMGFVAGGSLTAYFIARFAMGVGSGGVWIAVTYSTIERWPGQEYACMSQIFAAYSIGGLLGPVLGAGGGVGRPFVAYLALAACAGAVGLAAPQPRYRREFRSDWSTVRERGFWLASTGIFFAVLGLGIVDGILPLHFSTQLATAAIGGLLAGAALANAFGAILAARVSAKAMLATAVVVVTFGIAVVGASSTIAVWVVGTAAAAAGIGAANAASIGVLFDAVGTQRIVAAVLVWSQLGIVGYLAGPLAGGAVAQSLGYTALGLIPLAAAALVLLLLVSTADRARPEPV